MTYNANSIHTVSLFLNDMTEDIRHVFFGTYCTIQ
jgi:hypothetical protein